MTIEFCQEIANHKLIGGGDDYDYYSDRNIVHCHGISQDPETKNYVMVMEYIDGGNLRQYLQKNYGELSFESKLSKL